MDKGRSDLINVAHDPFKFDIKLSNNRPPVGYYRPKYS